MYKVFHVRVTFCIYEVTGRKTLVRHHSGQNVVL